MEDLLKEALKTAEIHLERLKKAKEDLLSMGSIEKLNLTDWEVLKTVDTFLFRFIKLQDFLGGKVFKLFLKRIGEYKDYMSFVDVLDKLERLRIVDDAESWLKIRELRNRLTHEYPEETELLRKDIKLALKYSELLEETLRRIENYLQKRGLI